MATCWRTGCAGLLLGGAAAVASGGIVSEQPVGFHEDAIMQASSSTVAGFMGWDVDLEGAVLIVGAPRQGAGHAIIGYLHEWGSLLGTEELAPSDLVPDSYFGWAVTINDLGTSGAAYVGAPGWSPAGGPVSCGGVYAFVAGATGPPTEVGMISPSSGHLARAFGNSVDFDGYRLSVGAFFESVEEDEFGAPYNFHGAVYVFDIGEDGLPTQEHRLVSETPMLGQSFGFDVSLDGDVLAIGAPKDSTVQYQSGAVYIFERQLDNSWLQVQQIAPPELGGQDSFGACVSLVGDYLVIGAPDSDVVLVEGEDPTPNIGLAYVYARVGGVFEQVQQILPPDPQVSGAWSVALSFDGMLLAIGARQWTNAELADGLNAGQVALYELGMDDQFTLGRVITASDIEGSDGFGWAVATSDERILVGSIEGLAVDGGGTPNGGMAYIYSATCGGDIDGDGAIDSDDLIELITHWADTGVLPEDVVQDYEVGIFDLLVLLEYFGGCG